MKGQRALSLVWLLGVGLFLSGCGEANFQNEAVSTPIEPSQIIPDFTQTGPTTSISPAVAISTPASVINDCKKIAFAMTNGSNFDIYTICPDGSNLINITNDPSNDSHPSWSADGKEIAFASSRAGSTQIFEMDGDGSNPIQLTSDYQNDFPIWLPNGRQVAFRTTDLKGLWWWRIVDIKSNGITQFSEPSFDFFFQTPAWSPDGKYIAYMSLVEQKQRNDGSSQIHIKNLADSRDTALTHDIWANINPVWSPDGTKIAFFSERDGTYNMYALYIMNKDGTGIQRITEPLYSEDISLSWSPDGQQIAIDRSVPLGDIYIIDIKTGASKILPVADGDWATEPSWQP